MQLTQSELDLGFVIFHFLEILGGFLALVLQKSTKSCGIQTFFHQFSLI